MRRPALIACLGFALVLPVPATSAAEPAEGVEIRSIEPYISTDPTAGPVEVFADTDHPTVARGALTDVFLAVTNHSTESTVSVVIDIALQYADGAPVRPFHLGSERVQTLAPDSGLGMFLFLQVPPDAPLGTATFRATARVGRVTGGTDGHDANANPMVASDAVEFEVVP